ncbi:MAG: 50S ribosomal protein L25/general stress protein Ctc [Gammaproteobacteria bacterium]
MSSIFEFAVESRGRSGTGAARAVRREGKVPAVIYGGGAEPEMLALNHNELLTKLGHEAVYSHILDIHVSGKTEKAILKEVQRHPSRLQILHVDFLRVSATDKVRVHVPLHFTNEEISVGVKKGGAVMHNLVDIEVSCLPQHLPEYIEVDLKNLDIGETVHLTNLVMPAGVEVVALSHGLDHDLPVVSISGSKEQSA